MYTLTTTTGTVHEGLSAQNVHQFNPSRVSKVEYVPNPNSTTKKKGKK